MSMTLTVCLRNSGYQNEPDDPQPPAPGTYFHAPGLLYAAIDLDRLIERPDVRPFSAFMYDGDMLCDEEYAEMGQTRPERQWFEPADGLRTIGHLIDLLERRDPEEWIERCTVDGLLWELQVLQNILRRAESLEEPFSFSVG